MDSSGWSESAESWIAAVEQDPNRGLLLDPVMLEKLGDVAGLDVLDVGCGEGRFCRLLAKRGAHAVGIDPTERLICEAISRDPNGRYIRASAEAMPLPSQAFDIVVSYVTLIDIPDFRAAIREMVRVLRPGGRLIMANLNSFVTSQPWGWFRDADRNRLHYPVDRYNEEIGHRVEWGGISIINWHRPMSAYFSSLLEAGLRLRSYEEPVPTPEAVARHEGLEDLLRVPLFHVMEWTKE